MNILDLFQAILLLGAPLVALSWFLFTWLFSSGEIDRQADHKAISSRLKKMKKVVADNENQNANYVYEKWSWFGTGFYGLAGLWTFAVIEISQFFGFIFNFPGFEALFGDGIISFLVELLINQFGNVIQAFVWFMYWPADSIIIWVLIAYLGYWVGVELARRNVDFPIGNWTKHLEESTPAIKKNFSKVVEQVKEKAQTISAEFTKPAKRDKETAPEKDENTNSG
ncbi:MAG: hypothetical protein GKR91_13165 [Pseudomonadales bacterium]|nr:hypothetical protein [Pseudomonadales bacterium]